MTKLIVLMYHGIYATDQEYSEILPEDRPYALHVDVFKKQLEYLKNNNINVLEPEKIKNHQIPTDINSVVITFDDGHIGFFKYAYPLLTQSGYRAIFFVTSDLVQNRPEFCSWQQLHEMAQHGMSIQSHGKTHKFLSTLSREEAFNELKISKETIERETGDNVWSISFPGGRYNEQTLECGQETGYQHYFTSKFDCNKPDNNATLMSRFAIRHNISPEEFSTFINPGILFLLGNRFTSFIKSSLKSLIGQNTYHAIYRLVKR